MCRGLIDLLKVSTQQDTSNFLSTFTTHSYVACIDKPTRITETTGTLIDNIFVNSLRFAHRSAIIYSDISDHLPILLTLTLKHIKTQNKPAIKNYTSKRKYDIRLLPAFNAALEQIDWNIKINNECHIDSYNVFSSKFQDCINQHFPLPTLKARTRNSPRKPWITAQLVKQCNKKSQLFMKWQRNPKNDTLKSKYVKFRNNLKTTLDAAERKYYHDAFLTHKNNLVKTWKLIKELITDNKPLNENPKTYILHGHATDDPILIANYFNAFFSTVGTVLDENIPNTNSITIHI